MERPDNLDMTVTLNAENDRKTPGFPPVVQKSIVADLLNTARKHMHHKTGDNSTQETVTTVCSLVL